MLYVIMLGGNHPAAKIEVHDVFFASAMCIEDTFSDLKKQWFGSPNNLHIDSWLAVDGLDGFKIYFEPQPQDPESPKIFFINSGGYEPGVFGELHNYFLIVAKNKYEAKKIARSKKSRNWMLAHIDSIEEIDECFCISEVGNLYIHLRPGQHEPIKFINEYIVI